MKEYLQHLADFNKWANQRFTDALILLPEDSLHQKIISSFSSLFETVKHLNDAESAWWLRLAEPTSIYDFKKKYDGNFASLAKELLEVSDRWKQYVHEATEEQLAANFHYVRLGVSHQSSVQDMLIHLFNHGTYHRGQLVTMMRQLGVESIPSTDFIVFTREVLNRN